MPEMSIYSQVSPDTRLIDKRPITFGGGFGTVAKAAKQYGIKYKEIDNCMEFTAPRSRLQIFVEKLHFSGNFYSKKPY